MISPLKKKRNCRFDKNLEMDPFQPKDFFMRVFYYTLLFVETDKQVIMLIVNIPSPLSPCRSEIENLMALRSLDPFTWRTITCEKINIQDLLLSHSHFKLSSGPLFASSAWQVLPPLPKAPLQAPAEESGH